MEKNLLSHPIPPIMYITFAAEWFMQILICISLLNLLYAGWNL